jgi:FkbM family methyltransferase
MPEGGSQNLFWILAQQRSDIYRCDGVGVRSGDAVLDCGAHVGVFTRKALKAGARKVVAIEPFPITLECLRRNIAEERFRDCVVIYPKGVWNKDDFLAISDGAVGSCSFVKGQHSSPKIIQLPLTTIDKVAAELALDRVDFIKIHVEGAEARALEGAKEVLSRCRPRLAVAAYHNREDGENLPSIVSQLQPGYKHFCGPCYSAFGVRPEVVFFHC